MSARSFRSVFMVASCAGAALGCYLVSLRVASERAALQHVEARIVMAERDIRLLETEIGTRGRLAQLERWNVKVLALSAPSADQFLDGGFALASLMRPEPKMELEAPVVLASASTDAPRPQVPGSSDRQDAEPDEASTAEELLHVASLKRPERQDLPQAAPKPAQARPSAARPASPVMASRRKPAETRQAVEKKAGDKPARTASAPVTKPVKTAKLDPLAPLPVASSSNTSSSKTSKDTDSVR